MQQGTFPVWWVIVKQEDFIPGAIFAYRIVKAIATTFDKTTELYEAHKDMLYGTTRCQPMLFHREPFDTPIREYFMKQPAQDTLNEFTSLDVARWVDEHFPVVEKPPEYDW